MEKERYFSFHVVISVLILCTVSLLNSDGSGISTRNSGFGLMGLGEWVMNKWVESKLNHLFLHFFGLNFWHM